MADVTSILGNEAFANPQKAHTGYDEDDRVLKLLVGGIGHAQGHAEVRDRCDFIETIPED